MVNDEKINTGTSESTTKKKDVVDLAKYKTDDGAAAFNQVMSQMQIIGRSAFDKEYARQWNEAAKEQELLSVLICEIDYFKEYLENYGQQGASFMLIVIALALKNSCEKHGALLAHYDKEEFAILIKGGTPNQVEEIAGSIRQAIEDSRTEHKHSKVSQIITLSIGVSSIYPKSMELLMEETNNALVNAKKSGRNQVAGSFQQA